MNATTAQIAPLVLESCCTPTADPCPTRVLQRPPRPLLPDDRSETTPSKVHDHPSSPIGRLRAPVLALPERSRRPAPTSHTIQTPIAKTVPAPRFS